MKYKDYFVKIPTDILQWYLKIMLWYKMSRQQRQWCSTSPLLYRSGSFRQPVIRNCFKDCIHLLSCVSKCNVGKFLMFIYIHILSSYKLFLYVNVCLNVMLASLSCAFIRNYIHCYSLIIRVYLTPERSVELLKTFHRA